MSSGMRRGIIQYVLMCGKPSSSLGNIKFPSCRDSRPWGSMTRSLGLLEMCPLCSTIVPFLSFLHPDRTKRLGNMIGGTSDVLEHPWFRGVDWGALERREITVRFNTQFPLVSSDRRIALGTDSPSSHLL